MDTDRDGTLDCNEGCPDDPGKVEPGVCGCGVPDTDNDSDGIPDCKDVDADGDGTLDAPVRDTAAPGKGAADTTAEVPPGTAAGAAAAVGVDSDVESPASDDNSAVDVDDAAVVVPGPLETPSVPEVSATTTDQDDSRLPEVPTADDTVRPSEDSAAGALYPAPDDVHPSPGAVDAVTGNALNVPDGVSSPAAAGGGHPVSHAAVAQPYTYTEEAHDTAQIDDRAEVDDGDTGGGGGGDDDF
jgi:hypothetical protein